MLNPNAKLLPTPEARLSRTTLSAERLAQALRRRPMSRNRKLQKKELAILAILDAVAVAGRELLAEPHQSWCEARSWHRRRVDLEAVGYAALREAFDLLRVVPERR